MGISPCLKCESYGDSKQDVDESIWSDKGYICATCCEDMTEEEFEELQAV